MSDYPKTIEIEGEKMLLGDYLKNLYFTVDLKTLKVGSVYYGSKKNLD